MLTQEQYEELRKVIIAANPEILKLEFGCKVKVFGKDGVAMIVAQIGNAFLFADGRFHYGDIKNIDNYDPIIGRDIRLADILIALGKVSVDSADYYYINSGGDFEQYDSCSIDRPILSKYNLHKDSLDAQSPELKEWLYGILVQGDTLSPTSKG